MGKYNIGDYVIYGINGACEVVEIGTLDFAGPDKIYYSLKPVCDARSTIFVPLDKEKEIPRMVFSKKEVESIIEESKSVEAAEYTPNREYCDVILKSGDNVEISKMIKLLRNMRKENRKNHKGLNIQEERILKDAEKIFYSEIACAFDMSMDEVVEEYSPILD